MTPEQWEAAAPAALAKQMEQAVWSFNIQDLPLEGHTFVLHPRGRHVLRRAVGLAPFAYPDFHLGVQTADTFRGVPFVERPWMGEAHGMALLMTNEELARRDADQERSFRQALGVLRITIGDE